MSVPVAVATNAESTASRRLGWALLAFAIGFAAWQFARHAGGPWGYGLRDFGGGFWSQSWAQNQLRLGFAVTKGVPVEACTIDPATGVPAVTFNCHHPPLYMLWLAAWGGCFGCTAPVLRLAHFVLFLVAFPATWSLGRRLVGAWFGGVAALLLAASPYVALFGPMVLHDGATLAFGLATLAAFAAWRDAPTRARWWATAALFFVTCSIDIPGYFFGPALFLMALQGERRGAALRAVVGLAVVAVVAFAVTALHCGLVLGGPVGYVKHMLSLAGEEAGRAEGLPFPTRLSGQAQVVGGALGALGLAALGALGAVVGALGGAPARRVWWTAVCATVPGLLNNVLFAGHLVTHAFWPLLWLGAFPLLAAIVPLGGIALWSTRRPVARALGAALLAAGLATVAIDLWRTPRVLDADAVVPAGLDDLARLQPVLGAPGFVFSDLFDRHAQERLRREHAACAEAHFGTTLVAPDGTLLTWTMVGPVTLFGAVATPAALQFLVERARAQGFAGDVTFVLGGDRPALADELARRADAAGRPMERRGDLRVFHLPLRP